MNINNKKLASEITRIGDTFYFGNDSPDWNLDHLSDYVYQNHHLYIEKKGPEIISLLEKLCDIKGHKYPELHEITTIFKKALGDLTIHMKKEELILFPFIKKIAKAYKNNETFKEPPFGSISNPIDSMHLDHENEETRFRRIAELSNNYQPPNDACTKHKITFLLLKEFEDDLHKHIHIENNILFEKAILLEKKLRK